VSAARKAGGKKGGEKDGGRGGADDGRAPNVVDAPAPRRVTRGLLRRLPLPAPDPGGDKETRGRVLVVGGSTLVPGAVLLAGVAALRAGAGKLQLATVRPAAIPLGLAVPEALVAALPATAKGEIDGAAAADVLAEYAESADAVLVGPGIADKEAAGALVEALVPLLKADCTLVLDGAAVTALRGREGALLSLGGRAVLTPHAGEMASALGEDKAALEADAPGVARRAARHFGAVVALKGADTYIAEPGDGASEAAGAVYHFGGGGAGLGTSGSGDTLSGIVAGLAARGATPAAAAVWGVWAHGTAGERLAGRMATVGYLARELLAEVPALVGRG
jgi:hydroxyethylthiazole kinase-like uncharacterized protein yjeF